jgi:hypothetical protein
MHSQVLQFLWDLIPGPLTIIQDMVNELRLFIVSMRLLLLIGFNILFAPTIIWFFFNNIQFDLLICFAKLDVVLLYWFLINYFNVVTIFLKLPSNKWFLHNHLKTLLHALSNPKCPNLNILWSFWPLI